MSPDADDLLLFARVAEAGSFSRAAERVQLPKSTVSRRIAALEKRLGERLLQRTTRQLVITDFGQGVLDHARVLSEEVDAALAFALSRQARPSGRLRVSMPADFASVALEAPLAAFVREYPEIALEIDLSPRRVDLIGENVDLAIRMGELQDDVQLAARRLAVFTTGLYASPALLREHGEPLTPDALTTMPGLMLLTRSGDALPWVLSPCMNILQVNSSARTWADGKGSQSTRLANELVAQLRAADPAATLVVRDLASHPHPHLDETTLGALFTPAAQRSAEQHARVALDDASIGELQAADVIVLGVAMVNFGITSQLKNWIDAITKAGVTFKYGATGPIGLVTGKKVYAVLTRGGVYRDTPRDTIVPYLRMLLGFLGMTDVEFVYAEGLAMGPDAEAKALESVRAEIAGLVGGAHAAT